MTETQPFYDPIPESETPVPPPSSSHPTRDFDAVVELFNGPINIRSIALTGLFLYSSLLVMYVAKAIILPIFVALILSLLLAPIMRALKKISIPAPIAAGGILLALVSVLTLGILQLSTPASLWLDRALEAIKHVEKNFGMLSFQSWKWGRRPGLWSM